MRDTAVRALSVALAAAVVMGFAVGFEPARIIVFVLFLADAACIGVPWAKRRLGQR